jgi:hypothetical protein
LCDLFLLFWSSAAKTSEWVMKEVKYALLRKGDLETNPPDIVPVILEGPPPVPPPPELQHMHFADHLMYLIQHESHVGSERSLAESPRQE